MCMSGHVLCLYSHVNMLLYFHYRVHILIFPCLHFVIPTFPCPHVLIPTFPCSHTCIPMSKCSIVLNFSICILFSVFACTCTCVLPVAMVLKIRRTHLWEQLNMCLQNCCKTKWPSKGGSSTLTVAVSDLWCHRLLFTQYTHDSVSV